jgi:hypothetical protein
MAVGYPNRDATRRRQRQHETTRMMHMTMDDIVRPVFAHDPAEGPGEPEHILRAAGVVKAAAKCPYFIIVGARLIALQQEIESEPSAIGVPHNVDDPRFGAAAIHLVKDVQHPDRPMLAHAEPSQASASRTTHSDAPS